MLNPRPLCCVLATLFLAACGTGGGATFESARYVVERASGRIDERQPVFNPAFRYLRATRGDSVAYLVLGYVDPTPEGPVEVWYTGEREVIRLRDGRLVGTSGLTVDWRTTRLADAPSWQRLLSGQGGTSFDRARDVMPGYHADIQEKVNVFRLNAYEPAALKGRPASQLTWFEERAVPRSFDSPALPPARFGVARDAEGAPFVVYSEQCLSPDVCYTFERWTPAVASRTPTAGS